MTNEGAELGDQIVAHARAARLGADLPQAWEPRVKALLASQPDIAGPIAVEGLRAVESGAGSSNGTLLFEALINGAWVEAVLRFAPDRPLFHIYDFAAQVALQRGLRSTAVPIARQICADIEGRWLGVAGYVMERVRGGSAGVAWTSRGVLADASPERRRSMMRDFVHTLVCIHEVDWAAAGFEFLLRRARGDSPIAREVNWFWDGLRWLGDPDALRRLMPVREWLFGNEPPIHQPVLCHGDANLTNYLFHNDRVAAVLDWEMAFLGAAECDLAYAAMSLTNMVDKFPEGIPSIDELFAEYARASGRRLQHLEYYTIFAYYRGAVILELAKGHFPAEFRASFDTYVDAMTAKLAARGEIVGLRLG
jgi:aminoglycoside phosphotransferase (APT) family kinase protein